MFAKPQSGEVSWILCQWQGFDKRNVCFYQLLKFSIYMLVAWTSTLSEKAQGLHNNNNDEFYL